MTREPFEFFYWTPGTQRFGAFFAGGRCLGGPIVRDFQTF